MRLDAIAATPRPRNAWEATDLGVAMVRRWLRPVYAVWFAAALPLFTLLHLLCWGNWWLIPWLLWWLKPLLDRAPLYVLSHALFGDAPDRRQFRRDLPGLARGGLLAALTWRRFDAARSFTLPVGQLEGLSGKARRQRLRTLGRPGHGAAVWLTVVCFHLEIALDFALITLVWMLTPDFVALEFHDLLDTADDLGQFWLNAVGFCGLSLVEPLYVAAGFALYLNRRIWLEAWDLELGFRRLAARLAQTGRAAAGVALLALGSGLLAMPSVGLAAVAPPATPPHLSAAEKEPSGPPICNEWREREARLASAASPVKQALAETLREPELRICESRQRWRFQDDESSKDSKPRARRDWLEHGFASVIEYLLWFAAGVLIAVAGWRLWRDARRPPAPTRREATAPNHAPTRGQDVRAIPPDAALAAWRLWSEGLPREALRLLYQGSLAGLATRYDLPVRFSATEDECLRLATARLSNPELVGFFRRLTQAWQAVAYAHRPPDDGSAKRLCEEWSRYFAAAGVAPA